MTMKLLLLLGFVAFAAGQVCTPGVQSVPAPDGCNACLCGKDGRIYGCTLKLCPPKNRPISTVLDLYSNQTAQRCTPGTTVPAGDGCNTCVCGPNGRPGACTLKGCISQSGSLPDPRPQLSGQRCTPGTTVLSSDGCNTCMCGPNGRPTACTLKACVPLTAALPDPVPPPVSGQRRCTPGSSVPAGDGCNTCVCQPNGYVGGCTQKGCYPPNVPLPDPRPNQGQRCTPGTSVPAGDGCNTCLCLPNGTRGGCTLKACY